ncbi:hypothetical protein Ancab_015486 [Ancistrocladus abbreviatus]
MEAELFENVAPEEDMLEVDAETDALNFEGERCGICMDIVIDRGVLDCCQHWFCFQCIDNWSTITNLCPLCQNEFQLITCVPVYDTIGSSKADEELSSRDDDWCVEGRNNTLSFPSYYIDENAVTCLDGDGCKFKKCSISLKEDLTLDTSIACDSCDIWYHAFCVGFDPEGASVDSWLCPRCLDNGTLEKSAVELIGGTESHCGSENADYPRLIDTFSGKVCISVADAGETAVVVSMIDGKHDVEEPTESISTAEFFKDHKPDGNLTASAAFGGSEMPSDERLMTILPNAEAQELVASTSSHTSMILPCNLFGLKSNVEDEGMGKLISLDESLFPTSKFHDCDVKIEPNESETSMCLDLGLSVGFSVSGSEKTEVQLGVNEQRCSPSGDKSSAEENVPDAKGCSTAITVEKRKHINNSARKNDGKQVRIVAEAPRKSYKPEKNCQRPPSDDQINCCASDDFKKSRHQMSSSFSSEHEQHEAEDKTSLTDIISIVQGTECRGVNGHVRGKASDNLKSEKNATGLRMKKIIRRPADDKESSILVQKLRKEIRDAVRNKSLEDASKSIFDPKLLAAFRAAVTVPVSEPIMKLLPSAVKAKKIILQKGKARENLTKKIYATSSGKRKRAWDRECEVEFWKHRCIRSTKPEKIDTLKSVLNLLRKSPERTNLPQSSVGEFKSPFLSRLYLADASVFPRKDDIKPFLDLKATGTVEQNKLLMSAERDTKPSTDSHVDTCPSKAKIPSYNVIAAGNNKNSSNFASTKIGVTSKVQQGGHVEKSSLKVSGNSKINSCKATVGKSDEMKSDKRKWALEVLARKTGSDSKSSMNQKEEDNAALKGNYPLLAQLPSDMRPKLAPSRHNKIPIAIRQAQLYRLTEHFLRIENLSCIRRTAITELAVADAVNIEKEVADKSNSKVVYLNLCSQELRRRSSSSNCNNVLESNPSSPSVGRTEGEQSLPISSCEPEVEAALRATGLLSDSPPASPCDEVKDLNDDDNNPLFDSREGGPDNVFEMDSHPELDIYGEFEYNLDDEDYIGASAVDVAKKSLADEESKMKLVFSTLSAEKPSAALSVGNHDRVRSDIQASSSCLPQNDVHDGSSAVNDKLDSLPLGSLLDGGAEELSLAECEELYGPDKEPLINKLRVVPSADRDIHGSVEIVKSSEPESDKAAVNNSDTDYKHGASGRDKSPCHSQTDENNHDGNHSGTKINKGHDNADSVAKKVEAYIKEHIRPLCKSGVITVKQYRWAVSKTTDKVMKYHSKAKNANFLIKEGEKVKKLAEEYVEAAKRKENT